jgi:hypothetical protein
MKNVFWYSINIPTNDKVTMENYLKNLQIGLQNTHYTFKAYVSKITTTNNELIYYIREDKQYLFSLIKYRYPQIENCNAPNLKEVISLFKEVNLIVPRTLSF